LPLMEILGNLYLALRILSIRTGTKPIDLWASCRS
jgi:hypothetical protein